MYERFTDRARKVMHLANQEAQRLRHEYIGTEHVLLGLLNEGSGVAANVLKNLDVDLRKVRSEVEKIVLSGPEGGPQPGKLPQTPRTKKVVEYTIEEARSLHHNYVGTEHLLLGLLREQEGVAARVLMNLGLRLEDVREEVLNLLGHNLETDQSNIPEVVPLVPLKSKTPALDSFGRDLTDLARQGKLDPVIGRTREIEEVVALLLRRDRRAALLVGDSGIGVTGVVEGLAQLLAASQVPLDLKDTRLVALDTNLLIALSTHTEEQRARGHATERLKAILHEARRERVLLFMGDLSALFAAPATGLAPLLWNAVRDGLLLLAAATPAGLCMPVEGHALPRDVFQLVPIRALSREEVVETVRSLRCRYESHHRVRITDEALKAAVALCERALPGRCPAEAALEVLDRASALRQLRSCQQPSPLREIDARIEQLNREKETAVAEQDFASAARLRDRADRLKQEKEDLIQGWLRQSAQGNGAVDEELVNEVVRAMTGRPLPEPVPDEVTRLLVLEEDLRQEVVGQQEAVSAVVRALRGSRASLMDSRRARANFLFAGPTGVGKSHLARHLALCLFGDENALVRIDMVAFTDPASGQGLVNALRGRRPGILLFDRADRAHPAVRDRLLSLLEEGVLDDGEQPLDLRDSIVVLTTTVGGDSLLHRPTFVVGHGADHDHGGLRERVLAELEPVFRSELLGRVEVVLFRELSRTDLKEILDRHLEGVTRRLAEKEGLVLLVTEEARERVLDEFPQSEYGARPLRRSVEQLLLAPLEEQRLRGHFHGKHTITVRVACPGSRSLLFNVA